jgi:hypothetical protein
MKVDPFWIWLAGFVDGDGCITVGRRQGRAGRKNDRWYFQTLVQIINTDEDVMQLIAHRLETKCAPFTPYSDNPARSENWKPAYRVSLYGNKARWLCKMLLPYLRVKRNQAEIVANWKCRNRGKQEGSTGKGGSDYDAETYEEQVRDHERLKFLNHRGA